MRLRHPNRAKRQHFPVTAARFREARLTVGLGVEACADLLRISERTVRNWESGSTRIPFAAYKLLRVLRGGKQLGPEWRGFHVWREWLVTPEGRRFHFSELAWWSLLVRRARAFSELRAARDAQAGASAAARPDATATATALGLVSSSTRGTRTGPETGPAAENKGSGAGHLVGAEERPAPGSLPGLRPVRGPAGGFAQQRPVAGGAP